MKSAPTISLQKPRLGISTCLLGENVRWDGGHKKDAFLLSMLGQHVEWIPFCPEVAAGMGIPREPVRLVDLDAGGAPRIRMRGTKTETDWTRELERAAREHTKKLLSQGLSGYVLKRASPSCGMERVKVYGAASAAAASGAASAAAMNGVGLFAAELMARFPLMPVEEEGRLCDAHLRESFVERVFAYQRLQELTAARKSVRALAEFHARHKYQLMAHSESHLRRMGRLVAAAKGRTLSEIYTEYSADFMAALKVHASVKKHTNVLQHIFGHFSEQLSAPERQSVLELIAEYHRGLIPLVAPVSMLSHYIKTLAVPYVQDQLYLQPHPRELMLRNHA